MREVVQEAMTYLDKIKEKDLRVSLIDTLRTITEGKVILGQINGWCLGTYCFKDLCRN